jgi:signal transduction histidine kinase
MARNRADWLVGGGEMARLIKATDWSATPLGPIETWPHSLRTTVSLVQASSAPSSLSWGPGHTQIYNDSYRPICGANHPTSMGQDFRACWATSPVIDEAYDNAWLGRSGCVEQVRMFVDRHGFLEEAWFTFSFSPIADESGGVGGVFAPVTELTGQMLSERRTRSLCDLAIRSALASTGEDALRACADVLGGASLDVPFAICYLLDDSATQARRVAQSGISAAAAGPELVELGPGARSSPWSIAEAVRGGRPIVLELTGELPEPAGPYPERPTQAMVLPILQAGRSSPAAVVVAGVSARLRLTDAYHVFYDLISRAVAASLAHAMLADSRRQSACQLENANQALEAFGYSVSHDLRAPLRAISGFSQILLADHAGALDAEGRAHLERIVGGARRMGTIITDLLKLSQVGRRELCRQPIDLATIARSIVADLTTRPPLRVVEVRVADELVARCDGALVTTVLENLLANAWKFTGKRQGAAITVGREDGGVFFVRDNGVGFDMAHARALFEPFRRFHAETEFEGTGIGLAIVHRAIDRHGGRVWANSAVGDGTTIRFTLQPDGASR